MPSFHLFSRFPAEIRFKIWDHAVLDIPPQVVGVYTICFNNPDEDEDDDPLGLDADGEIVEGNTCYPWLHRFISKRNPPSILHACVEARLIALQKYQLGFRTHSLMDISLTYLNTCDHLNTVSRQNRKLYFNPQRDIVHYFQFSDALVSSGPGPYTYICTPENTTTMWFPEATTLQSTRFVSVKFEMLLQWLLYYVSCFDLRNTQVLAILIGKDPRHSDYQSAAWSDYNLVVPDTNTWEESKAYLERTLLELILKLWDGDFKPQNMEVKVHRTMEDIVEEVTVLRSNSHSQTA